MKQSIGMPSSNLAVFYAQGLGQLVEVSCAANTKATA